MYKLASRNMQRRAEGPVGAVSSSSFDQDFIPSAGNMSLEECRDELRQLAVELARTENELIVAKREQNKGHLVSLGHRIQGIVQRRGVIKQRIKTFRDADTSECLAQAIREVLPNELQRAVLLRARAIEKERFA